MRTQSEETRLYRTIRDQYRNYNVDYKCLSQCGRERMDSFVFCQECSTEYSARLDGAPRGAIDWAYTKACQGLFQPALWMEWM